MKKAALIALSALMTVGISAAAFAGSWQVDNRGWWYLNDNGTWPVNTWQTINGKNYYFDTDGYMAESQYIGGTLVNITGEALPTAYGSIIRDGLLSELRLLADGPRRRRRGRAAARRGRVL